MTVTTMLTTITTKSATRDVLVVMAIAAAVGCHKRSSDDAMASGSRYLDARQFSEAAIEFENAARLDPNSAAAQAHLGDAYDAAEQPTRAAAAYDAACRLNPADTAVCINAASHLLAIGEFERAQTSARTILDQDRFNLDGQLLLASALAGSRRFADAEDRVRAALARVPQDPKALSALGDIQRMRGRNTDAEATFRRAVSLDPTSPARAKLAELLFDTKRDSDAVHELRAALTTDENDVVANRAYGRYLQTTAQCDDAEAYLKRAAEHSRELPDTLSLADFYVKSGRTDDALRVLKAKETADPNGAIRDRIASILYDRGEHDAATKMLDDSLTRNPSDVGGLLLQARLSMDKHDTMRARDLIHRAAALAPSSPAVKTMLTRLSETP